MPNLPTETDDYENLQGSLNVSSCENIKCLDVRIVDDPIVENDETIVISASMRRDRITFDGEPTTITIHDNDSM